MNLKNGGISPTPGERIRIVYGAGPLGASADRYAEKDSRFWIGVDGDGDGIRKILPDSPGIDVEARGAAGAVVTLPTVARPDEEFRAVIAVLDALGSRGVRVEGELVFDEIPEALELPKRVPFSEEDRGVLELTAVAREPGVYRLNGFEIATRMSYLIVGTTPDDALLDAAAAGAPARARAPRRRRAGRRAAPTARRRRPGSGRAPRSTR